MDIIPIVIALFVGIVIGVGGILWFSNRDVETLVVDAAIREICMMPGGIYRYYLTGDNGKEYWVEFGKPLPQEYKDRKWTIHVEDDTDIVVMYPHTI